MIRMTGRRSASTLTRPGVPRPRRARAGRPRSVQPPMARVDQRCDVDAGTCDAQLRATFFEARGVLERARATLRAPSTRLRRCCHWTPTACNSGPGSIIPTTGGYLMHHNTTYELYKRPRPTGTCGARALRTRSDTFTK